MAAGRGVGMNVVLNTVRELGGRLSLHTEPGRGTRFTIELPITLLITDVLIVTVAGQTLAIPQASVREVIKTDLSSIMSLQESELLPHRDTLIPLLRLSRLFGWHAPETDSVHILIVASGGVTVGLIADRILGQREIVVHSLADPLVCVPGVAGATQLGDGRAILILDVAELVRTQQEHASNRTTDSLCTVPTNFDNQKQA
jgi:two-component system chemotaxis sensor kinase CheA